MILVTGGTGFVGRHLVARLVSEGEQVRVLARRAVDLQGAEVIAGDVTDQSSLRPALEGCDIVVHLVGIIRETRGQSFRRVHVAGARNVIEACRQARVRRLLHMSALGTRPRAASRYHRSKWEAEQLVRASGLAAAIFRPAVMFGKGGAFLPMIRSIAALPPVIPIIGNGMNLLQPIWVEDVVACFVEAIRSGRAGATAPDPRCDSYELGGPESYGFEQLVDLIAESEGIEKPKVHLPVWLMRPAAALLSRLSLRFPLTPDQLTMLLEDSVCDISEMRQTFGVEPASLREHLSEGA